MDEPSPGNLSHSVDRILTCLSLLIPAFSLVSAPAVLTVYLHALTRSPIAHLRAPLGSVRLLGTFPAQWHSTN